MCGIAGLIGDYATPDTMDRMLSVQHHRGPDAMGVWQDDSAPVILGHKRLSIIDLAGGAQPMLSPDGRYVFTYNGELFNYLELRPGLERKGWDFRTASDTEVFLAGLVLEGEAFLTKTIGEFAFALWDREKENLLMARDRVGVKPLYIAEPVAGTLAFASELKSLLCVDGVDTSVNMDALAGYFTQRFVTAPNTMVQGIKKIPPAHVGMYRDGKLSLKRYWDVSFSTQSTQLNGSSLTEARERFAELLDDSVALRLRSDVPYGVFLSGGIDSSVIASLVAQKSSAPVHTFSIGFQDTDDELSDAAKIAAAIGAQHTEFELKPEDLTRLPDVAWAVDEPFPDPIVLAMSLLAQKSQDTVKVVLTGEGADELLGGYIHHANLKLLDKIARWMPSFLPPLGAWGVGKLPMSIIDRLFDYPISPGEEGRQRLIELVRALGDRPAMYASSVSLFTSTQRQSLFSTDVVNAMSAKAAPEQMMRDALESSDNASDFLDRIWDFEYKTWLPDNILFKQDKTLMAHSVEGRVPYCDHRLVEFAAALPMNVRFAHGRNKAILRDVADAKLKHVPQAKHKKPFMVPLHGAYGKVMSEMAIDTLMGSRFRNLGLFSTQQVNALLKTFETPSLLVGKQVMALLMFALWEDGIHRKA